MIARIQNQPFAFGSNLNPRTVSLGCACDEEPVPSLIAVGDDVWAQAQMLPCSVGGSTTGGLFTGGPEGWDDWVAEDGWFIDGLGFYRYNGSISGNYSLSYDLVQAVAGDAYTIQITVSSVSGTVYVSYGDIEFEITTDGAYEFNVPAAENNSGLVITMPDGGGVTVESVIVSTLDIDVTAIFHHDGGDEVFDQSAYPGIFNFINGTVTLHMSLSATGISSGCFTLELISNCNDNSITSQTFKVVNNGLPDGDCDTLLIRACNDYDNIGFSVPFVPRIRILARMGWPVYSTEVLEERDSTGKITRSFGDRTKTLTIKTGILNEWDHAFLSTLPIWDHVYIENQEVVVANGKYEPLYGEGQWLNGAVTFDVSPKAELVRKVACGPAGTGCDPDNDPICFEPQMYFAFVATGSGIELQVTLVSSYNFTPGNASLSVNGSAPIIQTFTLPTPSSLRWSGLEAGQQLIFIFQDMANSNCVITKFFDVPEVSSDDCFTEGHARFVMDPSAPFRNVTCTTDTGYYTVRSSGVETTYASETTQDVEDDVCVWSSDEFGALSGNLDELIIYGTLSNDLVDVTLTPFSVIKILGSIIQGSFPDIDASSMTLRGYAGSTQTLDLSNLTGESYTVQDYGAGWTNIIMPITANFIVVSNSFLTAASVNAILATARAGGLSGGNIVIQETSAAPTGIGLTDKAYLIGTMGWTVLTN